MKNVNCCRSYVRHKAYHLEVEATGKRLAYCPHCDVTWPLRARGTLAERFWHYVVRGGPDECWLWLGGINVKGYGILRTPEGRRVVYAHRVAVYLAGRDVPDGMMVHHTCHIRRCVNDMHLEVVTYGTNNVEGRWLLGAEPRAMVHAREEQS